MRSFFLIILSFLSSIWLTAQVYPWIKNTDIHESLSSICMVDANHGWVVSSRTIYKYNGLSWKTDTVLYGASLKDISFPDTAHGWACSYYDGIIYKYRHNRWSVDTSFPNIDIQKIFFLDSVHGWFISDFNIIGTYNMGRWDTASIPNTYFSMQQASISAVDTNHVWIAKHFIYKKKGTSWSTDYMNASMYVRSVYFCDTSNGWALTGSSTPNLLRYSAGKWSEIDLHLYSAFYTCCFLNCDYGWFAGGNYAVKYENGGFTTYKSFPANGIACTDKKNIWLASFDGLYKFDTALLNENISVEKPVTVYPIPASEEITISGLNNVPCIISIYDINSTLMQRISVEQNQYYTLNIKNLPKGLYIINVSGNAINYTKKFIIQ